MTIAIAFEKRLAAAAHPFDLDVRFTTPARGLTALFGKSGAGKTTIINTIAGLVKPDAGRITIDAQTLACDQNVFNFILTHTGHVYIQQHASR